MSESLVPKFRIGGLKLPDYPASNVRHLHKENVSFVTHCVTRLRITLKDKNLANTNEIEKLDGVYGTKWANGQLQVILGNTVNEVYTEL